MQTIMWQPNRKQITGSQMMQFMAFINSRYELAIEDYSQLYQWSIDQVEDFWSSFWDFSQIIYHSPYHSVVDDINKMPGAKWFEGTTLNFAENLLNLANIGNLVYLPTLRISCIK